MTAAYMVLDVQIALKRMTTLRVSTQRVEADQVRYLVDNHFEVNLDSDELERLWEAVDSPALFREAYDAIKAGSVTYNSYAR